MLHVDDAGFVRAPTGLVYRRLTDMGTWGHWWPGVRTRRAGGDLERWLVDLRRGPVRGLRLELRPHGYRHDHGVELEVAGDLQGRAEFWLEPTHAGTVVHHLLTAETDLRPVPTLRTYRAVVRRGLWGLKDRMQTEVRSAIGVAP